MFKREVRTNQIFVFIEVRMIVEISTIMRTSLEIMGGMCVSWKCDACTVLMEGEPVNACLVLAVEADGKHVETIEGLSDGDVLHPIQQAFVEMGGMQCGFCTPGMILSAKALLDENKSPDEEEIRGH